LYSTFAAYIYQISRHIALVGFSFSLRKPFKAVSIKMIAMLMIKTFAYSEGFSTVISNLLRIAEEIRHVSVIKNYITTSTDRSKMETLCHLDFQKIGGTMFSREWLNSRTLCCPLALASSGGLSR
jgi:hypothetical protein